MDTILLPPNTRHDYKQKSISRWGNGSLWKQWFSVLRVPENQYSWKIYSETKSQKLIQLHTITEVAVQLICSISSKKHFIMPLKLVQSVDFCGFLILKDKQFHSVKEYDIYVGLICRRSCAHNHSLSWMQLLQNAGMILLITMSYMIIC